MHLNHGPLLKRGQNTKLNLASERVTQLSNFLVILEVNFVPDIAYTSHPVEGFWENSKHKPKQKRSCLPNQSNSTICYGIIFLDEGNIRAPRRKRKKKKKKLTDTNRH